MMWCLKVEQQYKQVCTFPGMTYDGEGMEGRGRVCTPGMEMRTIAGVVAVRSSHNRTDAAKTCPSC